MAVMAETFMKAFDMTLTEVGYLMLIRAALQAISMPIWGLAVDKGYSRRVMLMLALSLWSVESLLLGFCEKKWQVSNLMDSRLFVFFDITIHSWFAAYIVFIQIGFLALLIACRRWSGSWCHPSYNTFPCC